MKLYWKAALSIYLVRLLQLHAHAYATTGTLIQRYAYQSHEKKARAKQI